MVTLKCTGCERIVESKDYKDDDTCKDCNSSFEIIGEESGEESEEDEEDEEETLTCPYCKKEIEEVISIVVQEDSYTILTGCPKCKNILGTTTEM